MDKTNKYYDLISEAVKKHRKYQGLETILEDIIDDVYSHSQIVISTINDENVIKNYIEKMVSTSIVTVPKKLNFHKELNHKIIETDKLAQNIVKNIEKQNVNIALVDKMINSTEKTPNAETIREDIHNQEKSIQTQKEQLVENTPNEFIEDEISEMENVEADIEESFDIIDEEAFEQEDNLDESNISENIDSEDFKEPVELELDENIEDYVELTEADVNINESSAIAENTEQIEDSLDDNLLEDYNVSIVEEYSEDVEDTSNKEVVESEITSVDIDNNEDLSLEIDNTTSYENSESIDNSEEYNEECIEFEIDNTLEEEDDDDDDDVDNDNKDDENDESCTENSEESEYSTFEIIENEIDDSSIEKIDSNETTESNFDIIEQIESETDIESPSNENENEEDEDDDENDNNTDTDEYIEDEQNFIEQDIIDINSDSSADIDFLNENNEFEVSLDTDENELLDSYDNYDENSDLNFDTENPAEFDDENLTMDSTIVTSDTELDIDYNDDVMIDSIDELIIDEENEEENLEELIKYHKTDYSVFNYSPNSLTKEIDSDRIETLLIELNNNEPELQIREIYDLRFNQGLIINDIASQLGMELTQVVKALNKMTDIL